MELKKYQRRALEELGRYVEALAKSRGNLKQAWQEYWNYDAPEKYNDRLAGVPAVCMKVPTGGGKTLMASAALVEIFGRLPRERKVVVWLVPSESILTQTLAALSDVGHAYRARLEEDSGGRVEVYSKEMLLQGQNFSPATVAENLTVCVISYASIRIDSRKKDARKFYQENGALISFGAGGASLIEVLRELEPVIVVDESHNAKSELSVEMLENLNPSFVLELTATPREESNIICEVSAQELKAEQMIKLPVIIFPPRYKGNFLAGVIEFRDALEREAEVEERISGRYIRPIVLFQAEADTKDDSETFKKIREELMDELGIPEVEIAVKTSNVNELRGVDLLSRNCAIRYIITVNALKEGWDCPFAYILASLANRNSQTDVAQIVGRILRQPYAESTTSEKLNACYVFSRSKNFSHTVQSVADGLNGEGLDEADAVAADEVAADSGGEISAENLIETAEKTINDFKSKPHDDGKTFSVKAEFSADIRGLEIPQFFQKVPARRGQQSLFEDELLSAENLSEGFTLEGEDTKINFDMDIRKVDLEESGRYVSGGVSMDAAARYQKFIDDKPAEEQAKYYAGSIFFLLRKFHRLQTVSERDLKNYVRRVVDDMSEVERGDLKIDTAFIYAEQIKDKIYELETVHRRKVFGERIGAKEIFCKKNYQLGNEVEMRRSRGGYEKALYSAEGDMNEFEARLIRRVSAQENVTWWHRNLERRGFCLNGWLNHYPDFIVRLDSGKIILLEAKGKHLKNDESREKILLGREWQARAGENFSYCMVFDVEKLDAPNSYSLGEFLKIVPTL